MRRSAVVLGLVLLLSAPQAFGKFYEENCFNQVVTKNVMLRKYDYKYNWGSSDTLTKGKEGSSHVTSQNSTQGTTAGVDPGYSTGYAQAQSMSTSSKKPCNYFGADARRERDEFSVANADELKRDIARGGGESLRAFALLSGCKDRELARYFQAMRSHFGALAPLAAETGELPSAMDRIVVEDPSLEGSCRL